MVIRRRSQFEAMLSQIQKDGSDACFLEAAVQPPSELSEDIEDEDVVDVGQSDRLNEGAAQSSRCQYTRFSFSDEDVLHPAQEVDSERQLQLNPGAISSSVCVSVLIYDVLGFVVCFQWGALTLRGYSVLFGKLAGRHLALYMGSCIIYAIVVIAVVTRAVIIFCPSPDELIMLEEQSRKDVSPASRSPSGGSPTSVSQDMSRRKSWERRRGPFAQFLHQFALRCSQILGRPEARDEVFQELSQTLHQRQGSDENLDTG
eukprot:TRINITY_DN98667_c0_g1_i1.p1 TRINITY_DN98667_c0_g1~~TRINITY_DN98667_c0_g1_i1.p1  ORF type:complete len:293 (-),score=39.42 TRINITY_DN98667_c0_g1_i1:52-828(-)